jgi:hypothetical protein
MATNLQIDNKLIEKALKLGHHPTKKEAVTTALVEYIQRKEQEKVLGFFGKIDIDPDYNYKQQRKRA